MTCDRCAGCLVREAIYRHGRWWWKCLNCGARTDRAILFNRAEQEAAAAMQRAALERDQLEWSRWVMRGGGMLMNTRQITRRYPGSYKRRHRSRSED